MSMKNSNDIIGNIYAREINVAAMHRALYCSDSGKGVHVSGYLRGDV
jgi:hypothetical protein